MIRLTSAIFISLELTHVKQRFIRDEFRKVCDYNDIKLDFIKYDNGFCIVICGSSDLLTLEETKANFKAFLITIKQVFCVGQMTWKLIGNNNYARTNR